MRVRVRERRKEKDQGKMMRRERGKVGRRGIARRNERCSNNGVGYVSEEQVCKMYLLPCQKVFSVALPRNLLAQGISLHSVKVFRTIADCIEELPPDQLTMQTDRWL